MLTTSLAFRTLKSTLDGVLSDDSDKASLEYVPKYMKVETMSDAYEDELELGGLGLATEKAEGQALDVKELYEGFSVRYIPRKFGLVFQLTEELDEDGKYNGKYINAARRMKNSLYKTAEIDAINILARAANAAYVGGDQVPLASANHTIPGGGTFSNTLGTPLSPSRTALITMIQNAFQIPGRDGIVDPHKITKVLFPPSQWGVWEGILGSEKTPENNNNEINAVYGMGIKPIMIPYWTNTTTNWAAITDADDGLKFKWRRKPKARTWYDEMTEVINHGISARWARGWSNPRAFMFSNA